MDKKKYFAGLIPLVMLALGVSMIFIGYYDTGLHAMFIGIILAMFGAIIQSMILKRLLKKPVIND